MKTKLLAAVSVLALIGAGQAIAETQIKTTTQTEASAPTLKQDAKRAWEDTKENVSQAADNVSDAATDAYESIEAAVIGDEKAAVGAMVTIDSRHTAAAMLGQPVYNVKNEKIASVSDIILDSNGQATTVIVADGGVWGFGSKLAAFDYSLVSQRSENGDVIMPLSEETIKKAAEFSYDPKDSGKEKVRVMPQGSVSVQALLDGELVNPQNEPVAEVDNISFTDGAASQVIVAFDQTLGLGGKKAVVGYDAVKVVRTDEKNGEFDVKLSAAQATEFENFKAKKTN